MEQNNYRSGYTDFNAEIAEEVNQAHHLRYIITPSGRKLYLLGSVEQDAAEIEEVKTIRERCNAAMPSSVICELEDRAAEIRALKARISELEAAAR